MEKEYWGQINFDDLSNDQIETIDLVNTYIAITLGRHCSKHFTGVNS